jgi:hypothetical protein
MRLKDAVTEQITERDFAKVTEWVRDRYGAAEALRSAYERAIGRPFARDTMDRWLHPDQKLRVQPLYGSGKLFLIVAQQVIAAWGNSEDDRMLREIRKRVGKRPVGRPRKLVK